MSTGENGEIYMFRSCVLDNPPLSETWLVPNIMDNEITIPGYSLVRKDRHRLTKSCGGGVIILVCDVIPVAVMSDLIKHNFECLRVDITRPRCK